MIPPDFAVVSDPSPNTSAAGPTGSKALPIPLTVVTKDNVNSVDPAF